MCRCGAGEDEADIDSIVRGALGNIVGGGSGIDMAGLEKHLSESLTPNQPQFPSQRRTCSPSRTCDRDQSQPTAECGLTPKMTNIQRMPRQRRAFVPPLYLSSAIIGDHLVGDCILFFLLPRPIFPHFALWFERRLATTSRKANCQQHRQVRRGRNIRSLGCWCATTRAQCNEGKQETKWQSASHPFPSQDPIGI